MQWNNCSRLVKVKFHSYFFRPILISFSVYEHWKVNFFKCFTWRQFPLNHKCPNLLINQYRRVVFLPTSQHIVRCSRTWKYVSTCLEWEFEIRCQWYPNINPACLRSAWATIIGVFGHSNKLSNRCSTRKKWNNFMDACLAISLLTINTKIQGMCRLQLNDELQLGRLHVNSQVSSS